MIPRSSSNTPSTARPSRRNGSNSSQTSGQCSALYGWTPGTYMSQNGSHYWADHGRGWQAILTFYYSNLGIDTWSGSTCSWPLVQRGATGYRVQTV